jgi:uncharacterized HAD superfamily protein
MATRLKIGVDIDGVIADFTGGARRFFKEKFGGPSDSVVQTGWGFDSLSTSEFQMPADHEAVLWEHVDATPNWWCSLEPEKGTSSLAEVAANHDVYFITNRKSKHYDNGMSVRQQTQYWLRSNFGIEFPTLIMIKDKGPIVRDLQLDYFIDDRDSNLESIINAQHYSIALKGAIGIEVTGAECIPYVMNQPYNPHVIFCPRVMSFDDFAKEIGAI